MVCGRCHVYPPYLNTVARRDVSLLTDDVLLMCLETDHSSRPKSEKRSPRCFCAVEGHLNLCLKLQKLFRIIPMFYHRRRTSLYQRTKNPKQAYLFLILSLFLIVSRLDMQTSHPSPLTMSQLNDNRSYKLKIQLGMFFPPDKQFDYILMSHNSLCSKHQSTMLEPLQDSFTNAG